MVSCDRAYSKIIQIGRSELLSMTRNCFKTFLSTLSYKFFNKQAAAVIVRDCKGLGCNVALIKYTLDPGKPKGGLEFRKGGYRGQMGNRGS